MVLLTGFLGTPAPGSMALERAVPLTVGINRRASPASCAPSPTLWHRTKAPSDQGRNNNPHSCPAIRGFVQSGFNEVALE